MGANHVSANPIPIGGQDEPKQLQAAANFPGAAGTIIPAVAGKRISLHAFIMSMSNSSEIGFVELTTAGATVGFGVPIYSKNFSADNVVAPYQQWPYFTVGVGNALGVTNYFGSTVTVNNWVLYVQG